jgi:hypothetical protein
MAKQKTEWLNRGLVTGPYLCLCLSEEAFLQVMRKLKIHKGVPEWVSPGARATMHECTNPSGQLVCIVCMRDWEERDPISVAGVLVHEAVHVFQTFCESIGEKTPSKEFEAYSIQHISQQLTYSFRAQTQPVQKL